MQLLYTLLVLCTWQCGTQAGPSYENERISKPQGTVLDLWARRICPQIFNQLQSTFIISILIATGTGTLKKISPWNLDTDPLEDYWESQWANQIDNSSQLTECLLIKSCSSASQSTINCGFWEKPTAWFLHPATRLGFSAPSGRSASDGDNRHTVPSKDTLKGTVHTRYPPKKTV